MNTKKTIIKINGYISIPEGKEITEKDKLEITDLLIESSKIQGYDLQCSYELVSAREPVCAKNAHTQIDNLDSEEFEHLIKNCKLSNPIFNILIREEIKDWIRENYKKG